ncbi:unnamed protein product [Caenorhabditis bovis]|uniref:Protein kinase domain-containing protein n=1 Tax=Caenorhabditis bovis TaxID=2654633 RepID=A0A8S1EVH5_9PELO|nr:unnamed protein product [Caenorhabditis bovis]
MSVTVEQEAYEMPSDNKKVLLKIDDVHLHSCGVFSNVYRGRLREPYVKEIAIKKTWPEKGERNFEFIFLTGREREKHKHVIQMIYAFSHTYGNKVCESYVFEFMPNTLADVIKLRLNDFDVKLYTWQIFCGLKYLEEHCVIHRDLKPVNILVDHFSGLLKISDFGSSKVFIRSKANNFYQVTRFYRPPELLMKSTDYDTSVDVWSAGCVVAEMIRRSVVFPGRDSAHQMKLYCRCFGAPTDQELRAMKAQDKLDSEQAKYTKGYGLRKLLSDITSEQNAFLRKVLVYTPDKRLHGRDVLKDEYFAALWRPGAVRSNEQPVSKVISPEEYKKYVDGEESPTSKRLALLTLAMKSTKDQFIPACEKSNSYENVQMPRKSTLIPKEQKMAREQKSREDNSREERSRERAQHSDEHVSDGMTMKKNKSLAPSMMATIGKKGSRDSLVVRKSIMKMHRN